MNRIVAESVQAIAIKETPTVRIRDVLKVWIEPAVEPTRDFLIITVLYGFVALIGIACFVYPFILLGLAVLFLLGGLVMSFVDAYRKAERRVIEHSRTKA